LGHFKQRIKVVSFYPTPQELPNFQGRVPISGVANADSRPIKTVESQINIKRCTQPRQLRNQNPKQKKPSRKSKIILIAMFLAL